MKRLVSFRSHSVVKDSLGQEKVVTTICQSFYPIESMRMKNKKDIAKLNGMNLYKVKESDLVDCHFNYSDVFDSMDYAYFMSSHYFYTFCEVLYLHAKKSRLAKFGKKLPLDEELDSCVDGYAVARAHLLEPIPFKDMMYLTSIYMYRTLDRNLYLSHRKWNEISFNLIIDDNGHEIDGYLQLLADRDEWEYISKTDIMSAKEKVDGMIIKESESTELSDTLSERLIKIIGAKKANDFMYLLKVRADGKQRMTMAEQKRFHRMTVKLSEQLEERESFEQIHSIPENLMDENEQDLTQQQALALKEVSEKRLKRFVRECNESL